MDLFVALLHFHKILLLYLLATEREISPWRQIKILPSYLNFSCIVFMNAMHVPFDMETSSCSSLSPTNKQTNEKAQPKVNSSEHLKFAFKCKSKMFEINNFSISVKFAFLFQFPLNGVSIHQRCVKSNPSVMVSKFVPCEY